MLRVSTRVGESYAIGASGAIAVVLVVAALVVGCGGSGGHTSQAATPKQSSAPAVPKPPFARVLPANYRAQTVWREPLTHGAVHEAVISSVGPPIGSLGFHPADLQVLSWDAIASRWIVLFDAQKVTTTEFAATETSNLSPTVVARVTGSATRPLLDPKTNVTLGQVRFAHLLPGRGEQMIFSGTATYGNSSIGELVIVDFRGGVANAVYTWSGDGGVVPYRLAGKTIVARASFWTEADPHCCPVRTYEFTVGPLGGSRYTGIGTLTDQRPWLGLFVTPLQDLDPTSAVRVVGVVSGSPAAGVFKQGDVILELKNAPQLTTGRTVGSLGPKLFDQLATLNAGARAVFSVARGPNVLTLSVKLGSLIDPSAASGFPPNDYRVSAI